MKRILSIEIGTEYTKVCDMDYRKKNPKVYNSISFKTPSDTVEDGYIRDKDRFVMELRKQLKDAHIKEKDVVFTVSSSKIANREIIIPAVKEKKILEIINAGAQDYFPVDISEYTITYSILERKKENAVESLRLLLMAAPDNLIKNYYNFSEIAEFNIVAIDYIGNSIYQLAKREFAHEVVMAVQINEKSTLINVMNEGVLVLQRTIPYGNIDALDEELAATLSEEVDFMRNTEVKERVSEAMDSIVRSIGRVMDYYYSQNPDKPIKELALMGSIVKVKNINQIFVEKLSITTTMLESLSHKVFAKGDAQKQAVDYMACIGAAYAPINFISKDATAKEVRKSVLHMVQLLLGLSILLSAAMIALSVTKYMRVTQEQEAIEQRIQELSSVEAIYIENKRVMESYNQLKAYDTLAQSPNDKLDVLIVEMEKALPTSAYISSVEVDRETLVFNVETTEKLPIAKMIMNFKDIKEIKDIYVPSINAQLDENGVERLTYTLVCNHNNEQSDEDGEAGLSNE